MGLLRLALAEGVPTPRYAMGVAAGIEILRREKTARGHEITRGAAPAAQPGDLALLRDCWPTDVDATEAGAVLDVVREGLDRLARWREVGFAGLALDT
jgi:hypothetical protein